MAPDDVDDLAQDVEVVPPLVLMLQDQVEVVLVLTPSSDDVPCNMTSVIHLSKLSNPKIS